MATALSIFADRYRKAIAAVGIGVRPAATTADSSVPLITSGSAAPSASDPNGSLYLRTAGAPSYRVGSAWAEVQTSVTTPLTLTAAAEAGNAIAVTMAGPAQVAKYKASVYDADGLLGVVGAWRIAETGAGAEVTTTAKPTLFFTTDANGAATLTVTDVSGAHAGAVTLLVEPASVQAGTRAGGPASVVLTFA